MEIPGFIREHIIKRARRSSGWGKVRKKFVKANPRCACCGRKEGLQVHHIKDFSEHPELELDTNNLIVLCGKTCHLLVGHFRHWKSINPNVREMCQYFIHRIKNRR